ncbi:MAG: response regulator transcription factor [Bacteroidota bacterium]|jgi:DNA-binding NarL/FixJ family response regulator
MIRILIVDDHVMFREGLKQILAKHRDMNIVGEVGNGTDALQSLRSDEYDVVVLDISMPGQSGWDILNEIKLEKPGLPVLILSMHPEDQYAIRMLKAGASGYISKESVPEELILAIRKVASGGKYVSPALAEKIAYALDSHADKLPHQLLSNREFQVMSMLASGKSLKEIAEELSLSEKTITTYRARILEKLNLRNNVELTHYVIENKLLP